MPSMLLCLADLVCRRRRRRLLAEMGALSYGVFIVNEIVMILG